MRNLILAAACLALQLHPIEPAAAGEIVTDHSPARAASVRVEAIALTQEPEVPAAFTLPLIVTNDSGSAIVLSKVELRFLVAPGTFGGGDDEEAECKFTQGQIESGSSRIAYCTFVPKVNLKSVFSLACLAWHWRTLTFSPGAYQVLAVATYKTDEQIHYARSMIPLGLRPTIWQVLLGACFGAFLLALFVTWGDYHAAVNDGKGNPHTRVRWFQLASTWAVGWLSASILVFMTYRMRDAGFPISITVSDFYGGIVLGLFGFVLASALRERFLGSNNSSGSAPKKAGDAGNEARTPANEHAPGLQAAPELPDETTAPDTGTPDPIPDDDSGDRAQAPAEPSQPSRHGGTPASTNPDPG